jgi:hypothetical protein
MCREEYKKQKSCSLNSSQKIKIYSEREFFVFQHPIQEAED